MPNTTQSIPEIPIQDHRPPVPAVDDKGNPIQLKPDVDDFLKLHEKGRGDRAHVINSIVRIYRDCLPPNKRGAREDPKSPPSATSTDAASPQPKLTELKKASNG